MIRQLLIGIVTAVLGAVLLCGGGLAALVSGGGHTGGIGGSVCAIPLGPPPPPISPPAGGWQPSGRFDPEQVGFTATIAGVGARTGVPLWGWIIAVATAIQESDLRNLPGGDRDSVGLFQQRPSQGWGTREQLQDPVYAASAFYDALLRVPDWQALPLTEAAQKVQKSAYPNAYADHEGEAFGLVSTVLGLVDASGAPMLTCTGATGPWTQPVLAPLVSGFRTADRPTHDGVDLAPARGTPIKAASTGTVTVVACNITAGYSCDTDGSPEIRGCGWYVDLRHADGVTTRYCHQLTHPYVEVGQQVTVGEIIGLVGSSGNSSGPHLHYEIHREGTPVDPADFMRQAGAPLT